MMLTVFFGENGFFMVSLSFFLSNDAGRENS